MNDLTEASLKKMVYIVRPYHELHRTDASIFENGGRIIAPKTLLENSLDALKTREVLQFRIHSPKKKIPLVVGILDFHQDDEIHKKNAVYLPKWVQKTIGVTDSTNDTIIMSLIDLPKATRLLVRPLKTSFLLISDPKNTLDNILPNYSAIIKGQMIRFWDNETKSHHTIKIIDVDPKRASSNNAVSLINTDTVLEFDENWVEKCSDYDEYLKHIKTKNSESSDVELCNEKVIPLKIKQDSVQIEPRFLGDEHKSIKGEEKEINDFINRPPPIGTKEHHLSDCISPDPKYETLAQKMDRKDAKFVAQSNMKKFLPNKDNDFKNAKSHIL